MANMYFRNGNGFTSILDIVYPQGSVYMSTNSTSPAESVGGTWTPVYDSAICGTPEAGVDTVPYYDGDNTHTLTTDEMPKHQHVLNMARCDSTGEADDSGKNWGCYNNGGFRGRILISGVRTANKTKSESTGGALPSP